jgi:hypothetical protein
MNEIQKFIKIILIKELLPTIKCKWPNKAKIVIIRQDNTPICIKVHDSNFF